MASRSLGTLTIDLIAKTGGFQQGMDKAGRATDKMARETKRKMDRWAKDIDRAFNTAVLAGTAAFAGLSVAVKRSIDDMYALVNQAKQVAMPIDQFTAFAAAADNAEVKTQDFMTATRTLLRNLQNAQLGSTRMRAFFEALGIDPGKIKTGGQAIDAVADSFAKYRDDANKAAIATQLMGSAGAAMIPFLDQGSKAIHDQAQHMRDLGVAFGQDGADKLSTLDDAMDEFHNTIKGLTNTLALALVPNITAATQQLTDFAQSSGAKDFASGLSTVLTTLARAALVVAAALDEIGKAFGGTIAIVQQGLQGLKPTDVLLGPAGIAYRFAQNAKDVKATAHEVTADIAASTKKWMDLIANFGTAATSAADGVLRGDQVPAWMKAGLPIGNNRPAISLPKTPAPAATAQRTVTDTGLRDLQAQIEKTASFYDKYEAAIRGVSDQQLAFIHTADEATKQLHAGNITWDAYQRIIDRARDSLDGIDKQVKKTSDTMSEFAVQAAHNMQDAFADFLFDPFKDGLKGMLGSFIDTLRRMAANAIAARLFDKLLGGKDGTTGGTGGGLLSSFLGAIFGGGRAYGGAVAAGGLYEINEQSAPGETLNVAGRQYLMMGPQGGTVEPLQRSRGMGSTTINVAVQPTSTRRTADQVADAIARKQRLAMARNG